MFGKIIGGIIGFVLLRSVFGAMMGAMAGHFFIDVKKRRSGSSSRFDGINVGSASMFHRQDNFFKSFFVLLGKLSKIDGHISQEEHIYISNLLDNMRLQGAVRNMAQQYFNDGSNDPQSYLNIAKEFVQITAQQPQLRTQLIYQLVGLACADKVVTKEERKFLEEVAGILNISETELTNHINSFGVKDHKAYHVLGVNNNASAGEIKNAYKQAMKEFHPDILKSKGLPPSMLEFAQKRFQDIQNAWEQIKKERNIS